MLKTILDQYSVKKVLFQFFASSAWLKRGILVRKSWFPQHQHWANGIKPSGCCKFQAQNSI